MLEFKETIVELPDGGVSKPFSLVVEKGDVVCLCGPQGSGKSRLLRAILGLEPISGGFITVDGELVTPGSSFFFRKMMAYIPQQLPHDRIKVSALVEDVFGLQSNASPRPDPRGLLAEWQTLGIDHSLFDATLDTLDTYTLQLVLLSFLPSLGKEIILIDDIPLTGAVQAFIDRLASLSNAEIVYTSRENRMGHNKIINL